MPLSQENINAFMASFVSILGAECNEYLDGLTGTNLIEKQVELCHALLDLIEGKTEQNSQVLQKIEFSKNFYITDLCLRDPINALPQSEIDLRYEDKAKLIEQYREQLIWYINKTAKDYKIQPIGRVAQGPPAQLRALVNRLDVITKRSVRTVTSLQPDTSSHVRIMRDKKTYKFWFAYLGQEQSATLKKTYDKLLAAKNPKLMGLIAAVDKQIPMTGWSRDEKKHAYLYYYHYVTLIVPTPNKAIDLNKKLAELQQARLQAVSTMVPVRTPGFTFWHESGYYQDPVLAEVRALRQELRYQRFLMEIQNSFLQQQLYSFYHQKPQGISPGEKRTDSDRKKDKKNPENNSNLTALFAVIGLILLASSGMIYGTKKLVNSVKNIFQGKKVLRSLYRTAAIIIGLVSGIALGFYFGLPALITSAGAALAEAKLLSIFIAGSLGVATGALIAKYTARLFSAILYSKEINPSNPEKYQLGAGQQQALEAMGVNIKQFNQLMQAVRDHKKAKFPVWKFWSSWPWTEAKQQKNDLNMIIADLKSGKILGKITFNGKTYDLFAREVEPGRACGAADSGTSVASERGPTLTHMYSHDVLQYAGSAAPATSEREREQEQQARVGQDWQI